MTRREGQFAGHGGLRLYWQSWLPDAEPRAVVLLAHGYAEHGGRYGHLVDRLVPRGIAIYALDHRGHGRSGGPRGHVGRFAEYVADLHALRVRVAQEQKGKLLFLLGHSMGGLIVVRYLLAHGQDVAGAVLSSPALGLADEPSAFLQWLARLLSRVAPRLSFQGNVKPEFLSRDPSVGEAYTADPLVHRRASARFFTEFKWAIANAQERAAEIRLPMLVLQAGDDHLVDADSTRRFAEAPGAEQRDLRIYPALYHELFNAPAPDRDRVFTDLESWIESRLVSPS